MCLPRPSSDGNGESAPRLVVLGHDGVCRTRIDPHLFHTLLLRRLHLHSRCPSASAGVAVHSIPVASSLRQHWGGSPGNNERPGDVAATQLAINTTLVRRWRTPSRKKEEGTSQPGVGGPHTTTRELQTCTFERPGASNTTKIRREDPERYEKNENVHGKGKKSAKFWAPPPFRSPTLLGSNVAGGGGAQVEGRRGGFV